MIKIIVILAFVMVACNANAVDPPKVFCGETPKAVYKCIGNPVPVSHVAAVTCDKSISECDRMRCIFKESRWFTDNKVDKTKVSDYFDRYAQNNPDWSSAVQQIKTVCLGKDLPAQGIDTNCPEYDILFCISTSFARNASPSQWSTSVECASVRQFVGACPFCPSDCFAPAVPYGSCNACLSVPRTP